MNRVFRMATLIVVIMITIFSSCSSCKKDEGPTDTMLAGGNRTPPIANAGDDRLVFLPVDTVTLDGKSAGPVRLEWRQISGGSCVILSSNTPRPHLTNLKLGSYAFELRVTDATGLQARDTVAVVVNDSIFISDEDIYIVGNVYWPTGNKAVLWKNGVVQDLGNGSDFYNPSSVFVSGSDVYVLGSGNVGGPSIKIWKNGIIQSITGANALHPTGLFVSGPDVYVSGTERSGTNTNFAKLWKNGVGQNLTDGSTFAVANSVFVSRGSVYVAGYQIKSDTLDVARLWKEGVVQKLEDDEGGQARSVFVSDAGDVYVAGPGYSGGTIWKNGLVQRNMQVSEPYGFNSLYVSGADVYAAGYRTSEFDGYPALWKNGVLQKLGSGSNFGGAPSVFVLGKNVYVVGWELVSIDQYTATLWKNGVAHDIGDGSNQSGATAVFVVKK